MWKLAIEDDQGNRTVVNLVRDEYSIGRAEENTVRLTERNISRRHAKLSKNGTGWVLTDLKSYNGCYLNGARIPNLHKIAHGDLLQFGDYRLELIDESARIATGTPAATIPVLPKSQSLVGQPDRLVMLVGPAPGAEFPLLGSRLVVGRGEECDLPLNHSSVSRVHAEVHALGDGRYEIIDRDSANGVRINGVELKRSLIDARDSIELGDVVLKFIPAGEIYRPGVDDTQQISSSSSRTDRPSPAPGVEAASSSKRASSGLKIAAGLATLGALVALGMVTLRHVRPGAVTSEPAAAPPVDGATKVLGEATAMLDRGNVVEAHAKIQEIPVDSNARHSPEFRRIEAGWADAIFAEMESETDPVKKRGLLEQIATSNSVDSVRRNRAVTEIGSLDAEHLEVSDLPNAAATPEASKDAQAAKPAQAKNAQPKAAKPRSQPVEEEPEPENPYRVENLPASSAAAALKPPTAEELAVSGDRQKVVRAKAILENKVNAGRATEQEIRMLKALCRQLGDASCSQ
ncbi:MAG TPA: FHA domain-containing protein [Polyangiaceae bacterium]|nr:FHA domain-containing protein [Polyangiaceae bacterium]